MKKPWPSLSSDEAAERFVEEADLTEYDFSQMVPFTHEFEKKNASVHMRMPQSLLDRVKAEAQKRGIPYQRFMRELVQRGLQTIR